MPTIVLSNHYTSAPLSIIAEVLPTGFDLVNLTEASREELLKEAKHADYILASGRLKIDALVLDAAPRLKMIQRTGVGLDAIDLDVLRARDIPLYVNQGVNSDSVAEHTLMLILATLRRLPTVHEEIKSGIWIKQGNGVRNRELKGKTVGIIGMGHIGRRVAELLIGFGVKIVYNDVHRMPSDMEDRLGAEYMSFDSLLGCSDIITMHCPLSEASRNLIGSCALSKVRRGCIIVNTARGGLIDEAALAAALNDGTVFGAGLDVFPAEPIDSASPLLKCENVVLTPHIGGVTYDSFKRMMSEAMSNIACFESGEISRIENRRYI